MGLQAKEYQFPVFKEKGKLPLLFLGMEGWGGKGWQGAFPLSSPDNLPCSIVVVDTPSPGVLFHRRKGKNKAWGRITGILFKPPQRRKTDQDSPFGHPQNTPLGIGDQRFPKGKREFPFPELKAPGCKTQDPVRKGNKKPAIPAELDGPL